MVLRREDSDHVQAQDCNWSPRIWVGDDYRHMELLAAPSRRQFLTGMAALGAGALIPGGMPLFAQTAPAKKRPRRIDVHHHPSLPNSGPQVRTTQTGPAPALWTPETALQMMDQGGVDLTILSAGTTNPKECRTYNDYMAKLVSDYPGRFGMFTSLPFPDIDGCLKEIAYGMDDLKADGVRFGTSYDGKWLGDPVFAPLFEELNRRKTVVYTHPGAPTCCAKAGAGHCRLQHRVWNGHHAGDRENGLLGLVGEISGHAHDFFSRRRHHAVPRGATD